MQKRENNESEILAIANAYKIGELSIGQFAKKLEIDYEIAMKLLSEMGMDVIDYDFEDDMTCIDKILTKNV